MTGGYCKFRCDDAALKRLGATVGNAAVGQPELGVAGYKMLSLPARDIEAQQPLALHISKWRLKDVGFRVWFCRKDATLLSTSWVPSCRWPGRLKLFQPPWADTFKTPQELLTAIGDIEVVFSQTWKQRLDSINTAYNQGVKYEDSSMQDRDCSKGPRR